MRMRRRLKLVKPLRIRPGTLEAAEPIIDVHRDGSIWVTPAGSAGRPWVALRGRPLTLTT